MGFKPKWVYKCIAKEQLLKHHPLNFIGFLKVVPKWMFIICTATQRILFFFEKLLKRWQPDFFWGGNIPGNKFGSIIIYHYFSLGMWPKVCSCGSCQFSPGQHRTAWMCIRQEERMIKFADCSWWTYWCIGLMWPGGNHGYSYDTHHLSNQTGLLNGL